MKRIHLVSFCALALIFVAPLHAAPPIPTGLFYLPSGQTLDVNALTNVNVDGVVIGARWSDLEPSPDTYVFDYAVDGQSLKAQLEAVEGVGKPMRLAILTGGPGVGGNGPGTSKGNKPEWLISMIKSDSYTARRFFTYYDSANTTATIPVFWEPTLLSRHAKLVQKVADYLGTSHPLVKVVFVAYANANTNDWNVGDTSPNQDGLAPIGSSPQQRWLLALPGSQTMEDALIDAGDKTFSAYHTAFPNKILTTSIGRLKNDVLNPGGKDVNGRNISEAVVTHANAAWPGFIVAQKNNLNGGSVPLAPGTGTAWEDLDLLTVPHAAQMVWRAYDDCNGDPYGAERMNAGFNSRCADSTQMLYQAVQTGISYSTKWQEVYEPDILNLGNTNADPNPLPAGVPLNVIRWAHLHLTP